MCGIRCNAQIQYANENNNYYSTVYFFPSPTVWSIAGTYTDHGKLR